MEGERKKPDSSTKRSDQKQEVKENENSVPKGTGIVNDEMFLLHKCPFGSEHGKLECPERLNAIQKKLTEYGLLDRCVPLQARLATNEELLICHSQDYIYKIRSTATMSQEQLKEYVDGFDDLECVYIGKNTYECACLSAGSVIDLTTKVVKGELRNGIALVRPPGHHAQESVPNGYCIFNNIALAARQVKHKFNLERILIVDFDVHHGQGLQQMFEDDPSVLYFSIHQYGHETSWPNLIESSCKYIGVGAGQGYNINIPWNEIGLGDAEYLAAFQQVLLPVAYEYNPQLVLVACGVDASIGDPEGFMRVSPACYAHLMSMIMGLADGKVCCALEGGYCLESLSESISMVVRTLLGDVCPQLQPQKQVNKKSFDSILETIANIKPFWKCFQHQDTSKVDVNIAVYTDKDVSVSSGFNEDPIKTLANMMAEIQLTVPKYRTCLVYDDRMRLHHTVFNHPERPERVSWIFEKHEALGLVERCRRLPARYAVHQEIELCHNIDYIETMEQTKSMSFRELAKQQENYESIYLHPDTYACARLALGGVLTIVDDVLTGKSVNGTAIVRPPGHHAEEKFACGFCIFNTVAVAAKYAKQMYGVKRVLIVDWDIHHGNGTQNMFDKDPSVLYISLHRYDEGAFFPASSRAEPDKVGLDKGAGFNINIAWNWAKMGDAEYLAAFQKIIMPVAYEYAPDLVFVSAGFDAALGDPLGGYLVNPECYGQMTHMLSSLANGHVIVVLEGGYNLSSISKSMAQCTQTLLGDPTPVLTSAKPANMQAVASIHSTIQCHKPYWKCLQFIRPLPVVTKDSQSESGGNGDATAKPSTRASAASSTSVDDLIQSTSEMSISSNSACPDESFHSCSSDIQSPEAVKGRGSGNVFHKTQPNDNVKVSEDAIGAVGGVAQQPGTIGAMTDILGENMQMYAVVPLTWCPHLEGVTALPEGGLHADEPCFECGDSKENWVCLHCYMVLCGRYVESHMVKHGVVSGHCLVLSYADLSVWCYECDSYVHNGIIIPMKRAAHISKFGTDIPGGS
ncbi:histone deacetylase 6-like [Antedon mediterranea]|uniref:histone deacetylase 6-like n=1 Tax=Antedon mediterranea TaxID=105859 RepID=UPI003AF850F6